MPFYITAGTGKFNFFRRIITVAGGIQGEEKVGEGAAANRVCGRWKAIRDQERNCCLTRVFLYSSGVQFSFSLNL